MGEGSTYFTNRRLTRRQLLRGAALTSLGLAGFSALAGCQPAPPAPAPTGAPAPKPAVTSAPAAPAPTPGAAAPKAAEGAVIPSFRTNNKILAVPRGKEVNPIRGGTVKTFVTTTGAPDPVLTTASAPAVIWSRLHAGNGILRPRGDWSDDMAWEPGNVESWEVSKDGLTWTLKLRKDVYWHDMPPMNGRKFVASDIGWSIDYYNKVGLFQHVWSFVGSWEAPDDYTLVLKIKELTYLPYSAMTSYYFFVLPKEVQQKNSNFKNEKELIGTGPWMVESVDLNGLLALKRNPKYFEMGVDGKPLPYIDRFEMPFIPEYAPQLAALRARQIDLWCVPGSSGPQPGDLPSLKQTNPELYWGEESRPLIYRVEFYCANPPFNDPRARLGVSKAIDRWALADAVFLGKVLMSGWVPGLLEGYAYTPDKVKQVFAYDPNGAKQLLQQVGLIGNSKPVGILQRTVSPYNKVCEVIQAMLKDVGMNAALVPVDSTQLYDRQLKGNWEMFAYVGTPAEAEPLFHILAYFQSKSERNVGKFADAKLDTMIADAYKELDEQKRKKMILDMQDYMATLMPSAPLFTDIRFKPVPPWLVNMPEPHWTYGYPRLERAWLDNSKRPK